MALKSAFKIAIRRRRRLINELIEFSRSMVQKNVYFDSVLNVVSGVNFSSEVIVVCFVGYNKVIL